jgi:lipopolysaccharide heptosyltransferase II
MNILQVLPELNSGGVETGTLDLSKELIRHGHKSVVISNGGKLLNSLIDLGAIHYKLPVHEKSPFTIFSMIEKIVDIIKNEDIDIVHARSRAPAFSAFFAAHISGKPFITTCHGYYSRHFFSRVMGWGRLVIVPSNVVARHMIDNFHVPRDRIRLIPRGVDLDKFPYKNPADRQQKKEYSIGIIGRITPIKGHIYLIRAISKVARILPNIKLYIIGKPPSEKPKYKQELETLVKRLGLSQHIEFSGDSDNVPEVLKNLDLLVVPSIGEETFGRVIIEAQAAGVPVIASRIGGIVDIIRENENGILVNPKDYNGIADAILKVIKDKDLQKRLSAKARSDVERYFSLEIMYTDTIKVYNEALDAFRILIIKWSSLGDIILALPALKAVKEKFPKASIAFLTSRQGLEITGRFPYIKDFFVIKQLHGIKGFLELSKISAELRRYGPNLICDLQNNKKSHIMSFLSCSRRRIGYKTKKFDFLMNEAISGSREIMPPVQHQFRLLKMLGIDSPPEFNEISISQQEAEYAQSIIKDSWAGKNQKLIGINLGSSKKWQTKQWPLENIARLADLLAQHGVRVFITGTKEDSAHAKKVITLSKSRPFDITGKTSVMQLAAFIKRCDAFITSDSAPMHIAGFCKVPVVALFGPTDPDRHIQSGTDIRLIYKKQKCSPCYRPRCSHITCMHSISPEEVLEAVKDILTENTKIKR